MRNETWQYGSMAGTSLRATETGRKAHSVPAAWLVLYIGLSLADLCLTRTLIRTSAGAVDEGNPIAAIWLAKYGWLGLILFKILAMALVILIAALVSHYRPRAARHLLLFACLVVGVVIVYSSYLLATIRVQVEPEDDLIDLLMSRAPPTLFALPERPPAYTEVASREDLGIPNSPRETSPCSSK